MGIIPISILLCSQRGILPFTLYKRGIYKSNTFLFLVTLLTPPSHNITSIYYFLSKLFLSTLLSRGNLPPTQTLWMRKGGKEGHKNKKKKKTLSYQEFFYSQTKHFLQRAFFAPHVEPTTLTTMLPRPMGFLCPISYYTLHNSYFAFHGKSIQL